MKRPTFLRTRKCSLGQKSEWNFVCTVIVSCKCYTLFELFWQSCLRTQILSAGNLCSPFFSLWLRTGRTRTGTAWSDWLACYCKPPRTAEEKNTPAYILYPFSNQRVLSFSLSLLQSGRSPQCFLTYILCATSSHPLVTSHVQVWEVLLMLTRLTHVSNKLPNCKAKLATVSALLPRVRNAQRVQKSQIWRLNFVKLCHEFFEPLI